MSILIAFLGGMLTLLSPCTLPVIPLLFASVRGRRGQLAIMLAGMALMFGAVSWLVTVASGWVVNLTLAGRGLALAFFALVGLSLLSQRVAQRLTSPLVALGNQLNDASSRQRGWIGSLLAGLAVGLLWAPCAGPVLGAILSLGFVHPGQATTGGLLLAGPPGSGKTTLLRSLVQKLCEGDALVSVIDERGELMTCEAGSLPRAAQIRCDVYARCTKAEGIAMALRCMNPQVIVCDELGTPGDAEAVAQGVASGVVFFATVHCDDPAGLRKKPALAALLDTGAFAKAAFLSGRSRPGAVAQWVTL